MYLRCKSQFKALSRLLTFKMAAQDEKESLLQEETGAEMLKTSEAAMESSKKKESKLILYHWTQSFSSQKVGEHGCMASSGIREVTGKKKKAAVFLHDGIK